MTEARRANRWRLVRNLLVFQLKLALDGVKDIVLLPLGLVAGLAGFFTKTGNPSRYLHQVMRLGRGYENWIDLYSDLDDDNLADRGLDGYLKELESAIAKQSKKGGLTTRGKAALDNALDALSGAEEPEESSKTSKPRPGDGT